MKRFNSLLKVFIFLTALLAGVADVWAATLKGEVAVGAGMEGFGTVTVEVYIGGRLSGSKNNATSEPVAVTGTVSKGVWPFSSDVSGYCKFTATPAAGYVFEGWYTSTGTKQSSSSPYSTSSSTSGGTYTYYAKFVKPEFYFSATASVAVPAQGSASVCLKRGLTVIGCGVQVYDTIVAGNGVTSASDSVIFTATPNPGYRFVKWMNGISDLTNGTRNPCRTMVSNSNYGSTASRNYTAYFEAKKSQSISWRAGVKTNVSVEGGAVDLSSAVSVTPDNRSYQLSFISSNTSVLRVEGTTIVPVAQGEANVYACVIEDDKYAADTTDVALTFTVSARATPLFTVDSENNLKVGDSFEVLSDNHSNVALIQCASESSSDIYSFTSTTTADHGVGTVTALKEGSVRLKFSQPATDGWNGGSTDWITVNISRHTTNLSVNTSAQTVLIGDTYNPEFTTNSEATPVFTSSDPSVAIYEDGVIRALAVGTATLTFSQPETDKWTADSKTIDVTVEKHPNPITVKFDDETQPDNRKVLHFDGTTAITFEAANTDFVVGASSNPSVATYADGTIRASHNLGTATFTVTQAETATHNAGSATFTVVVDYADVDCYVLDQSNITTMNSGTSRTFELSGLGAKLSIVASISTGSSATLSIYGIDAKGVENTTPLLSRSLNNTNQTYSVLVSRDVVKLRLQATGAVFFKNLQVTRLKTIEAAAMTFSENAFVGQPKTQDLSIYCSTPNGGDLHIICDNDKFSFAQTTIATDACSATTLNIPVTYTSSIVGTDVANLIIYNSTNRIETTITATTVKKDQTITWADNISPMAVGKTHTKPASAALSLNYEVVAGGESVLEILNGNQIHAIAPGTATVRAYNDGDDTWNSVSDTYTFTVTELKVQRIEWMQSFTNLKTGGENIDLDAKVYVITADGETEINRPITYTSADESVVRVDVENGNQLVIVGEGETTLTATQAGDAEYLTAEVVLPVKVREPSAGCEMFVLEKAYGTIDGVGEKVIELTDEPETISFGAWRTAQSNRTGGNLYLSEFVDGQWSNAIWSDETPVNLPASYGPIKLSRNATKIKFYTTSGATGKHSVSGVNVTLANYLEFADAPTVTENDVTFLASETQIGSTYTKTVDIRYSDIFDQLTVTHTNTKFTVTPGTIGNGCGDHGTATISIQYHATVEGTEEDVITITDNRSTLTIRVSATTQRNNQTITFNPASSISTTDNVTLSASATSTLPVSFELVSGEDYATVNSTGVISVLQGGGSIVVRAIQSGNDLYNAATPVVKTININKVTPTITTLPTAADVTLPATLASAAIDGASAVVKDYKGNPVAGSFAWTDATTTLVAGTNTYSAIFTPENTAFYTTTTCDLSVTASKLSQTIDWSLVEGSSYHYFQSVALDATATSGLSITYTSSDEPVAQIAAGAVQFIAPGEVILTASQSGNATYDPAESVSRTIFIVKATPAITTIPDQVVFYHGHSLSESPILGGTATVDGYVVEGTFSWKQDATPEIGDNYTFPAIFTPNNSTFFTTAECLVPVRVTPYDRVFTDATGNHLWSDRDNWKSGFVPEGKVDVTITNTLIIDCAATIGELTIEENAAVLVVKNGSLTVDHSGTSSTGRYGDLYVRDAASVTFNGDFQLRDLYLSSLLDSHEGKSKSAQVSNPNNLRIDGDVYFDLQIDATGECSPGWYDFTVPFPVDALNGVYRIEENGEVRKVTNEVNYAIMSYNEALRANGQYGWKKFRGIMQPGICYTMTIDDVYPVYRFRKTKDGALNTSSSLSMTYTSGTGSSENWGWNSLGNGTLRHADLLASGINKVQVYDHARDSYTAFLMSECSFVVGAAFFVQAVENASILTLESASHSVLRAPAATRSYSDEHTLILTREGREEILDRLYLSATEEDKSSYLAGHDLAKFETSTSTPQMWCNAYGVKLCDAELPLVENTVDFPLSISAPSAATYTLSVSRMVENETLYLVQDGVIIWNLSDSDYTFDLAKGTNSSYSVRLIRRISQVTTDMEQLHDSATADKFLMNGALYILRDGVMYDALGHRVK